MARDLEHAFSQIFHLSQPVSDASCFVAAMTHALDASITILQIKPAMKRCISARRRCTGQKPPDFGGVFALRFL